MGCSWVKSLLNQLIFLNIQDCVLTLYATYKERHLSLPSELKFADFSEFSEGEVERLRCSQAKPSLNPSIIFGIKACIFTISIFYDMRGSRSRIEWESQISLIIIKERGKAWGVGGSNFYQIPRLIGKR